MIIFLAGQEATAGDVLNSAANRPSIGILYSFFDMQKKPTPHFERAKELIRRDNEEV